jgi:hypothetical protein
MALTYDELSSVTEKYFVKKMTDNVFNSNALLQRLRKKNYKAQDGGTKIVVPVAYAATSAAGWYTGTDTLNTTANDQITAAAFDRSHAYASITVTHTDTLTNSGDAAMVDFVRSKVQLAEMTLKDNLGTGVFNAGTDSKALIGLRLAVDSAGTYGGISRTDYAWWASDEDSTTAVLTLAALNASYGDVTVGNDKPTVAVTTQDVYDSYMALLQPQQRFTDSSTADAGFENLMYRSIPIIVDSHCPANTLFFLNENYITLYYHPADNMRFSPFITPTDQNVATAKIYWAGQLVCSNCRMQAKLTALAA